MTDDQYKKAHTLISEVSSMQNYYNGLIDTVKQRPVPNVFGCQETRSMLLNLLESEKERKGKQAEKMFAEI